MAYVTSTTALAMTGTMVEAADGGFIDRTDRKVGSSYELFKNLFAYYQESANEQAVETQTLPPAYRCPGKEWFNQEYLAHSGCCNTIHRVNAFGFACTEDPKKLRICSVNLTNLTTCNDDYQVDEVTYGMLFGLIPRYDVEAYKQRLASQFGIAWLGKPTSRGKVHNRLTRRLAERKREQNKNS